MTAEYEITKDDLLAFNLYHYQHSPTARRQYLGLWLVPAFIWLLVCTGIWYLSDRGRGTPLRAFLELLPLFCGAPAYLIVFPWTYRRKLRKMVDSMVWARGKTGECSAVIASPFQQRALPIQASMARPRQPGVPWSGWPQPMSVPTST